MGWAGLIAKDYGFKDIDKLLEGLEKTDYNWESGYAKKPNEENLGA